MQRTIILETKNSKDTKAKHIRFHENYIEKERFSKLIKEPFCPKIKDKIIAFLHSLKVQAFFELARNSKPPLFDNIIRSHHLASLTEQNEITKVIENEIIYILEDKKTTHFLLLCDLQDNKSLALLQKKEVVNAALRALDNIPDNVNIALQKLRRHCYKIMRKTNYIKSKPFREVIINPLLNPKVKKKVREFLDSQNIDQIFRNASTDLLLRSITSCESLKDINTILDKTHSHGDAIVRIYYLARKVGATELVEKIHKNVVDRVESGLYNLTDDLYTFQKYIRNGAKLALATHSNDDRFKENLSKRIVKHLQNNFNYLDCTNLIYFIKELDTFELLSENICRAAMDLMKDLHFNPDSQFAALSQFINNKMKEMETLKVPEHKSCARTPRTVFFHLKLKKDSCTTKFSKTLDL